MHIKNSVLKSLSQTLAALVSAGGIPLADPPGHQPSAAEGGVKVGSQPGPIQKLGRGGLNGGVKVGSNPGPSQKLGRGALNGGVKVGSNPGPSQKGVKVGAEPGPISNLGKGTLTQGGSKFGGSPGLNQ